METDGWNGARSYLGIVPQSNANMIRLTPKTNLAQKKPYASSVGKRIVDALVLIPTAAMLLMIGYESTQIRPLAHSIEKSFNAMQNHTEQEHSLCPQTNSPTGKLENSVLNISLPKETTNSVYRASQTLNLKGEYK